MAAIPAIMEALPTVLSGVSLAHNVISKYAPSVKKVSSFLFKAHSKSPSHLLNKIRNIRPGDVIGGIKKIGSFIGSGKALNKAQEIAGDVSMLGNLAGVDTSGITSSGVSKVADLTRSYHNVLERIR